VLEGTPFASVRGSFAGRDREALERACVIGTERTMRQDPGFGTQQLTDIALRALSPGINDPTTACAAIDALTVLLAKLATRERVSSWRCDRSGRIRVHFRTVTFAELVETSFMRILVYGAQEIQVVLRLISACEQLRHVVGPPQQATLRELLQAVHQRAREQLSIDAHRRTLAQELARAHASFDART